MRVIMQDCEKQEWRQQTWARFWGGKVEEKFLLRGDS